MARMDEAKKKLMSVWVRKLLPIHVRFQANRAAITTVAEGLVGLTGGSGVVERAAGAMKVVAGAAQAWSLTYSAAMDTLRREYGLVPNPWPILEAWIIENMSGMEPTLGQVPGLDNPRSGGETRMPAGIYENGFARYMGNLYVEDVDKARRWVRGRAGWVPSHNAIEVVVDGNIRKNGPEGRISVMSMRLSSGGRVELSCIPSLQEVRTSMSRKHPNGGTLPVLLYGPSGSGKTLTAVCALEEGAVALVLPGRALSSVGVGGGVLTANLKALLDVFGCTALVLDDYLHAHDELEGIQALGSLGIPVVITVMDPELPAIPGLRPGRISAAHRFRPVQADSDAVRLFGDRWSGVPAIVRRALVDLSLSVAFLRHVLDSATQDGGPSVFQAELTPSDAESRRIATFWWRLIRDTADLYAIGAVSTLRAHKRTSGGFADKVLSSSSAKLLARMAGDDLAWVPPAGLSAFGAPHRPKKRQTLIVQADDYHGPGLAADPKQGGDEEDPYTKIQEMDIEEVDASILKSIGVRGDEDFLGADEAELLHEAQAAKGGWEHYKIPEEAPLGRSQVGHVGSFFTAKMEGGMHPHSGPISRRSEICTLDGAVRPSDSVGDRTGHRLHPGLLEELPAGELVADEIGSSHLIRDEDPYNE